MWVAQFTIVAAHDGCYRNTSIYVIDRHSAGVVDHYVFGGNKFAGWCASGRCASRWQRVLISRDEDAATQQPSCCNDHRLQRSSNGFCRNTAEIIPAFAGLRRVQSDVTELS